MINLNAKEILLKKKLDAIYLKNKIQPTYVPFWHEFSISLTQSISNENILIFSDLGLLIKTYKVILNKKISLDKIYFVCHMEEIRDFALQLIKNVVYVPYNKIGIFLQNLYINNGKDYNLNIMDFSVIIGNPPYNGILKKDIPKEFDKFLETGYQTYFPFIALAEKLKHGAKLMYIVPNAWLSDMQSKSLREELFKLGKFNWLQIQQQPEEWNQIAQIGRVVIFEFERGKLEHDKSIICTKDNRFPNIASDLDVCILQKFFHISNAYEKIHFFRGGNNFSINPETGTKRNFIDAHSVQKFDYIKVSKTTETRINEAKNNNQLFLIYPDFQRAPFKITGKNLNKIKTPVLVVDPQPIHDTFVVVPTKTPEQFKRLLECNVAKFIWRVFFTNRKFAPTLTGIFPNIVNDLSENFDNQEIYNFFNLTQEEIIHVENLANTYGHNM
jgi:hypothetical protein